jgi:hypothetical protein
MGSHFGLLQLGSPRVQFTSERRSVALSEDDMATLEALSIPDSR